MPMKRGIVYACFAVFCSASAVAQSWRDDQARVCFLRPENNGAMNVLESWIRIADYNLPVIGGQTVCLFVGPGENELTITSHYPYDPESKDDEACKSRTVKLKLKANENRTFLICPAVKGSAYTCGWRLAQTMRPNPPCE